MPVTDAGPATHPPPVEAIDDTIALGEMKALDLDPSTGQAASAAIPSAVLDLDRYAVLCAWTQLHPERREALHRQYGLESEAQRRALDAHFEQLFERDAELRAAFAHRLRMHVGYLGAGRG